MCGKLNLAPARLPPNSGYHDGNISSWGGSIVADPKDANLFHMFVSRMSGHCGLNSWQQNSELIHTTATDPEGPYAYKDTVLPVFAHGASVRALPAASGGGYMMMHLGCGRSFLPFITGCTNGTTPKHHDHPEQQQHSGSEVTCNQFNVSVMTAPTPDGPWSGAKDGGTQVYLSSTAKSSWYVPSGRQFSNPAPHIMENGTVLCAYRADARRGGEHVSVAVASGIAAPYVDNRPTAAIGSHPGEDPFLWQDERSHWHMLMHNMGGGGVGSHAYSRDAVNWVRSSTAPYTSTVTFTDGTSTNMHRRERPQLLLSSTGQPRYFSTGVEDYADHVYTLVMKVNTSAAP